jgi:hypothetical protein
MMAAGIILPLIIKGLPDGIAIFNDIRALFKKYPGVTPEQFAVLTQSMAGAADATYDKLIADIKADQAAHPPQ